MVENSGIEPLTSCVQSRRSPSWANSPCHSLKPKQVWLRLLWSDNCEIITLYSRKEVIQPQVLLRLPCYDFTPVAYPTFDSALLTVRLLASGVTNSHGVTGGVYKARERIHRAMADARLLANPTSWRRVSASNPNWDRLSRFASLRRVAALCTYHCNTCVAPDVRAVLIWRHPHLPLPYSSSPVRVPSITWWQLTTRVALVMALKPTPHGTSWRQPCST